MSIVHRTFLQFVKWLKDTKPSGGSGFQENKAFSLNVRKSIRKDSCIGISKHIKRGGATDDWIHRIAAAPS